ncbi:MAG: hypothetical protein U0U69_12680 [Acidimicrobiia bacterium]
MVVGDGALGVEAADPAPCLRRCSGQTSTCTLWRTAANASTASWLRTPLSAVSRTRVTSTPRPDAAVSSSTTAGTLYAAKLTSTIRSRAARITSPSTTSVRRRGTSGVVGPVQTISMLCSAAEASTQASAVRSDIATATPGSAGSEPHASRTGFAWPLNTGDGTVRPTAATTPSP